MFYNNDSKLWNNGLNSYNIALNSHNIGSNSQNIISLFYNNNPFSLNNALLLFEIFTERELYFI